MAKGGPDTSANSGASTAKRQAFVKYDEANKRVEEARAALEAAVAERTTHVKGIINTYGKGPFKWNGMILTGVIRVRKHEDTDEVIGETAFFKTPSKNEVQEV